MGTYHQSTTDLIFPKSDILKIARKIAKICSIAAYNIDVIVDKRQIRYHVYYDGRLSDGYIIKRLNSELGRHGYNGIDINIINDAIFKTVVITKKEVTFNKKDINKKGDSGVIAKMDRGNRVIVNGKHNGITFKNDKATVVMPIINGQLFIALDKWDGKYRKDGRFGTNCYWVPLKYIKPLDEKAPDDIKLDDDSKSRFKDEADVVVNGNLFGIGDEVVVNGKYGKYVLNNEKGFILAIMASGRYLVSFSGSPSIWIPSDNIKLVNKHTEFKSGDKVIVNGKVDDNIFTNEKGTVSVGDYLSNHNSVYVKLNKKFGHTYHHWIPVGFIKLVSDEPSSSFKAGDDVKLDDIKHKIKVGDFVEVINWGDLQTRQYDYLKSELYFVVVGFDEKGGEKYIDVGYNILLKMSRFKKIPKPAKIKKGDYVIVGSWGGLQSKQVDYLRSKPYFMVTGTLEKVDGPYIDVGYNIPLKSYRFKKIFKPKKYNKLESDDRIAAGKRVKVFDDPKIYIIKNVINVNDVIYLECITSNTTHLDMDVVYLNIEHVTIYERGSDDVIGVGDCVVVRDWDGLTYKQKNYLKSKEFFWVKGTSEKDNEEYINVGYDIPLKKSRFEKIDYPGGVDSEEENYDTSADYKVGDIVKFQTNRSGKITGEITSITDFDMFWITDSKGVQTGVYRKDVIEKIPVDVDIKTGDMVMFKPPGEAGFLYRRGEVILSIKDEKFTIRDEDGVFYFDVPIGLIKKSDESKDTPILKVGDEITFTRSGYMSNMEVTITNVYNDGDVRAKNKHDIFYVIKPHEITSIVKGRRFKEGDKVKFTHGGKIETGVVLRYLVNGKIDVRLDGSVDSMLSGTEEELTIINKEIGVGDWVICTHSGYIQKKDGTSAYLFNSGGKVRTKFYKNDVEYALVEFSTRIDHLSGDDYKISVPVTSLKLDKEKNIYKIGNVVRCSINIEESNKDGKTKYDVKNKLCKILTEEDTFGAIGVEFDFDIGGNNCFGKGEDGHCLFIKKELLKSVEEEDLELVPGIPGIGDYVVCVDYDGIDSPDIVKFLKSKPYHKVVDETYNSLMFDGIDGGLDNFKFKAIDFDYIPPVEKKVEKNKVGINIGDFVILNSSGYMSDSEKEFYKSKPYHKVIDTNNWALKVEDKNTYLTKTKFKKVDVSIGRPDKKLNEEEENKNKDIIQEDINSYWFDEDTLNVSKISGIEKSILVTNTFNVYISIMNASGYVDDYIVGTTKFLNKYKLLTDRWLGVYKEKIDNLDTKKQKDIKKLKMRLRSLEELGTVDSDKLKDFKQSEIKKMIKNYEEDYEFYKMVIDLINSG